MQANIANNLKKLEKDCRITNHRYGLMSLVNVVGLQKMAMISTRISAIPYKRTFYTYTYFYFDFYVPLALHRVGIILTSFYTLQCPSDSAQPLQSCCC
jgi:hypothetical protein